MTFRRRLLGVFAVIIVATVVAIGWAISARTREVFERTDTQRTGALVQQFQREFQRRGNDVLQRVKIVADTDAVSRMALDLAHGGDPATYLTEAAQQASAHQLDFLEFVSADGIIISSAQSPARFGYKEPTPTFAAADKPFLKREELQEGTVLGLFAVKTIRMGEQPIYVLGGVRLDQSFLSSLALPSACVHLSIACRTALSTHKP